MGLIKNETRISEFDFLNFLPRFLACGAENSLPEIRLGKKNGWRGFGFAEVWSRRDLVKFFVWRDLKIRYKQTLLGAAWALIQPLASMVVFTIFFGRVAKISSEGLPYSIFSYAALLPWIFISRAISGASFSLVGNHDLITKVYFPRVLLPLSTIIANLADFFIALALFVILAVAYGFFPPLTICVTLPALILLMMTLALGVSLWLSALQVYFRDIGYALSFFLQLWTFVSPVAYPFALIPANYAKLAMLNPVAGIIEGFRCAFLARTWNPALMISSVTISVAILLSGALFFQRMERSFADVV